SSSFYVSNDQWKKGTEIAYLPTERKKSNGVLEVDGIRLSKFIDDPHQKSYYIYNFDGPYDFHVELIKIFKVDAGKAYPSVCTCIGRGPELVAAGGRPAATRDDEDDDGDEVPTGETECGVDEDEDFDLFGEDEEEGG